MPQNIRYITHPQVTIDPTKDIQRWSLSDLGAARVKALAASNTLAGTTLVISSDETKAVETATPLATALACTIMICADMHENDRSATGYLPAEEFEQVADAFFASPRTSTQGWETAVAAQARIVRAYNKTLANHPDRNILFVGHGAVGTLLFCHLNNLPISRDHDQIPGGGCYFDHYIDTRQDCVGWRVIEDLIAR